MAGLTPRFGLSYFGGSIDGSLDDDGQKYTGADRLLIDRLFSAIEQHRGRVRGATLSAPQEAPILLLLTDEGGSIGAGETLFYRTSFVDADGLETAAGPEASITTPDPLPIPGEPYVEANIDTGVMEPGLYYYALTALRDLEESPLSEIVGITLIDGETAVDVTTPDLDGASAFQVWRMSSISAGFTRIGTTSTGTFTDDGSVPDDPRALDPDKRPPEFSEGAAIYSVRIQLSAADAAVAQQANVSAWRVYKSDTSGAYSGESLVDEVIEPTTPDGTDLMTTTDDEGLIESDGSPKVIGQQLQLQPYTFESSDALPSPTGYPEYYPLVSQGVLYARIGGVWTPLGGGGGGGGSVGLLDEGVVIGTDTVVEPRPDTDPVELGRSVLIGYAALSYYQSVVIGRYAQGGSRDVVIGPDAYLNVSLLSSTDLAESRNVLLGYNVYSEHQDNTAVGQNSGSYSYEATVLGSYAFVGTGSDSATALGAGSFVNDGHTRSTAVGAGAVTTAPNQVMLGTDQEFVEVPGDGIVLHSPNGSRWRVTVGDDGTLTTTAVV